jgi:hypothetical protein
VGAPRWAEHGVTPGHIDFAALEAALLDRAETLVPQWLPGGKRVGPEWVCADLSGGAGRSCSINLRIFSSELSTVNSMSCWNSGLAWSRCAFFIISESWVTMFLRSWTTKADMRLKESNLRASSSASVACICARYPAACRPAVFNKSRTSQFRSVGARGRASTTKPSKSSAAVSGTISQTSTLDSNQSGRANSP